MPVTALDAPRQTHHRAPSFLPDGRRFLYHAVGEANASGLYLASLEGEAPTRLTAADGGGAFLAPDRILFVQGGLVARRLDEARRELTGQATTLASTADEFSVSATGDVVAHRLGSRPRPRMLSLDRLGRPTGDLGEIGPAGAVFANAPELSPDERRLGFDRVVDGNRDVWLMDLARGGLVRLTTDPAVDGYPVWSPDGSRVAFESNRQGTLDLWVKPADGSGPEELLHAGPDSEWPLQWSRDGRFLLYQQSDLRARWDLWALPMTGPDRTPIAVANTAFSECMGQVSPDGRWVVYQTDESGRSEIMVQAFPRPNGRFAVSTHGGSAPRWNAAGDEIYFIAPDRKMMAVPVRIAGSTLQSATPVALFSTQAMDHPFKIPYAVARDGRFLINSVVAEASAPPISLILNAKP